MRTIKETAGVKEGALLVGRYDFMVRLEHSDRSSLYRGVAQLNSILGVKDTCVHVPLEGFVRDHEIKNSDGVAFVFIKSSQPQDVISQLKALDHIVEAHIISGDWDLVATIHCDGLVNLLETSIHQLEQISGMLKSETMIASNYFRKTPDETKQIGTYVPTYALERLRERTMFSPTARI